MDIHAKAISTADTAQRMSPGEESVDLLDLALVLVARRRFILLFSLAAAAITAVVLLLIPPTFTATTRIMPPQKESSASALMGQLGGLASLAGGGSGAAGMLGLKNPDDLYIGLMQSNTIEDGLIDRFHLKQAYKATRLSDARNALKSNTTILAEKSSLISIAVKDKDPKLAAEIANGYVAELHDLMSRLAVTEAAQRRLFFEQQLDEEKNKLAEAEVALENVERKTGIIQPQGQAGAVIATIVQLRAQISAREVELGTLRNSATDQNPEVVSLESQIAGLRAQLSDYEKGHPQAAAAGGSVLTPTSQVPAASLEYLRSLREMKYHETLFELMARQYEMARVDEAKQGQMIQVVDPAQTPDRKSWPPRTLLTLLVLLLAFGIASSWVIFASYQSRAAIDDPERSRRITELRQRMSLRNFF